jgi:hypothetical protein
LIVPLENRFPLLNTEGYTETSPASDGYNCVAWAAGSQDDWWWPDPFFTSYWPEGAPRAETVEAFYATFALLGYTTCPDGELETGFEKIALYAHEGKPTHATRQLADGSWTSKLGANIDITHNLPGLEGPEYGSVVGFMKRKPSQYRDPASS